jgi:hypothetical protein
MNLAAKPVPVFSASRVTLLEGDTMVTPFAFGLVATNAAVQPVPWVRTYSAGLVLA